MKDNGVMRISDTGATRNSAAGKAQITRYFSPLVLNARSEYMLKHQLQADGTLRTGDNWKKGFGNTPQETMEICWDSLGRHFLDLWMEHDGFDSRDGIDEALGGLMFNIEAYWDALIKSRQ